MNNIIKNRRFLWAANIVWIIIILTLCIMPKDNVPDPGLNIPHLDKVVHFGMFLVMSLLLCFLVQSSPGFSMRRTYYVIISFTLLYGGTTELLQEYFFGRNGDFGDLAADLIGSYTGYLIYPYIRKRISARTE